MNMSDALFPSGPWTGFYHYAPPDKHRMDLRLSFAEGRITGEGGDDVGAFAIRGDFDCASLECRWIKSYPGSHDVYYHGFREGKGIWGAWDIGVNAHGGFHIWPTDLAVGERQGEAAAQCVAPSGVNPLEAVSSAAKPMSRASFSGVADWGRAALHSSGVNRR
jgi:hypothetical protein